MSIIGAATEYEERPKQPRQGRADGPTSPSSGQRGTSSRGPLGDMKPSSKPEVNCVRTSSGKGTAPPPPSFTHEDTNPPDGAGIGPYYIGCTLISAVPCLIMVFLWSAMFAGDKVFEFLDTNSWLFYVFTAGAACIFSALYLLDFFLPPHLEGEVLQLWRGDRWVGRSILGLGAFFAAVAVCFNVEKYPWAPLVVTTCAGPILVIILRLVSQPRDPTHNLRKTMIKSMNAHDRMMLLKSFTGTEQEAKSFYMAAAAGFMTVASITLVAWIGWAVLRHEELETLKNDGGMSSTEKELAYLRWVAPLVCAISNYVFTVFVLLRVWLAAKYDAANEAELKLMLTESDPQTPEQEASLRRSRFSTRASMTKMGFRIDHLPIERQDELAARHKRHMDQLSVIVRMAGTAMVCAIGFIWIGLQLMAGDNYLAKMVLGFASAFFLVFVAFISLSFRRLVDSMREWLMHMPIFRMFVGLLSNDWIRAFMLTLVLPAVPPLLLLSAINQVVRRSRGLYDLTPVSPIHPENQPGPDGVGFTGGPAVGGDQSRRDTSSSCDGGEIVPKVSPEEACFTARIMHWLTNMASWDWLGLIAKMYVCGLVLQFYTICPLALNVFLSWLISLLEVLPFALVCVLTVLVGISCFLLPPVPGVPVYLFAGAIIPSTCPAGFWVGAIIAIFLGWILKLMACAMQQEGIGGMLGKSMWIRQTCGIHTTIIRTIESLLRRPGYSTGKLCVACGGPDWPTSVMCGVIGIPLIEMEIATLPIIGFILPCSLSGSFYLKKAESEFWSKMANFMILMTSGMSAMMMVGAAWSVQEELEKNHWEVTKPLMQNVDLEWLDWRDQHVKEACVIHIEDLPISVLALYVGGAVLTVGIGQAFYWLSTSCFGEFAVTDPIDTLIVYDPTYANTLISTLGLILLGLSMFALLGYFAFNCWHKAVVSEPYRLARVELEKVESRWKENRRNEAKEAAERGGPPDEGEEALARSSAEHLSVVVKGQIANMTENPSRGRTVSMECRSEVSV